MDSETPLLSSKQEPAETLLNHEKGGYSINTLTCDFLSKLPDKVKSGLDPECPFHIDFSKTPALAKGIHATLVS